MFYGLLVAHVVIFHIFDCLYGCQLYKLGIYMVINHVYWLHIWLSTINTGGICGYQPCLLVACLIINYTNW